MSKQTCRRLFLVVFGVTLFGIATCASLLLPFNTRAGISDTGVDTDNGETLGSNPKTRTSKVTVMVRDEIPPDAPILVSPSNGSVVTNKRPPFVWKIGFDAHGIGKYQFYLDGSLLFDSITTPVKTDPLYTYAEDPSTGNATLQVKNDLTEGAHTWKVKAFDVNGNSTNSATWSFTIDTTAPVLLVKSVGDTTVSVSAQDITTIPTSPIILTKNQPVISGTSEASASIKISVILPDLSVTTYTTTVASDGTWSITLGTLPYYKTIKLQVSSNDSGGNSALIDSIPIRLEYVTVKLPSPIDKITPEITITPPEVIKEEIAKVIKPYVPEPVVDVVDTVIPYSNSGIGFVLPIARLLAVLWLTGVSAWSLTLKLLERSAHAIGFAPLFHTPPFPIHTEGIVFDVDTKEPIPFALLTVFMHNNGTTTPVEEVVSHEDGTYETLHLKRAGSYSLVPTHRDYQFSANEIAKQFSGITGVYTGQEISSDTCAAPLIVQTGGSGGSSESENGGNNSNDAKIKRIASSDDGGIECFGNTILVHQFIPMIKKTEVKKWHAKVLRFAQLPSSGLNTVVVVMGALAFWSPTPWNIGMFLVYGGIAVKRALWA